MRTKQSIDFYFDTIIKEKLFSNKGNLKFHMNTLFKGIDFSDKKILDIGGGTGIMSFYSAFRGAKQVFCLEPECNGSSPGVSEEFQKLKKIFQLSNVELVTQTIQELKPGSETFDIILLHNSINHIDETACTNLLKGPKWVDVYQTIFSKIFLLSNKGAKIIICDCSKYNFFNFIKIRNPIVPTIEWYKHQAPETWANLLTNVGFVKPRIRWSSFNTLRYFGKIFTANKLMAFFLASHFCLTMEKT